MACENVAIEFNARYVYTQNYECFIIINGDMERYSGGILSRSPDLGYWNRFSEIMPITIFVSILAIAISVTIVGRL